MTESQWTLAAMMKIADVQRVVAEQYGLQVYALKSKDRHRPVARARMVAMQVCYEYKLGSLPVIGRKFGNRHHSTVWYACRKVVELRHTRPSFAWKYVDVRIALCAELGLAFVP